MTVRISWIATTITLAAAMMLSGDAATAEEIVISDLAGDAVTHTSDFTIGKSPFVLSGTYPHNFALEGRYLQAPSRGAGSDAGSIRVSAPAGRYYVYLAWVRHPRGAKDVRVRVGGVEVKVDQSRLANGLSPDEYDRDHMDGYKGICTSGLYCLTDQPILLREGDAVEITRSDTQPDTITSLDYVVFSPHLYLDDLGNGTTVVGQPSINLRNHGPWPSGKVGFGLAFIKPDQAGAAIEWTVPAEGLFVLSAKPNRGPSRAEVIPLEIELKDGRVVTRPPAGKSGSRGRAEWQQLAVFRAADVAKLRLGPGKGGIVCADLLRLTPISESDLSPAGGKRYDTFFIQWEAPSARCPWLRDVRVVPLKEGEVKLEKLGQQEPMPNVAKVRVARQWLSLLDAKDGTGISLPGSGSFRVELADDYGFTLSTVLLRRESFVWLRDLGIVACVKGDFASKKARIEALEARVEADRKKPFRSTSEKYFEFTGYDEARNRLVDKAFQFAYDHRQPPAARVTESLRTMPEVDYQYFCERIADVKHRRMFLGWSNVAQEFYVLSNGLIGISARSSHGTGHPLADDFTISLGLGDPPVFRKHGDTSVIQSIEDGYHLIVHTRWREGDTDAHTTAFAYPLAGEEVRTGNEPLAAFVRLRRSPGNTPLWLEIKPESWRGREPGDPLRDLAKARSDNGRLLVGKRVVLAVDYATATVESADNEGVLVKIVPRGDHADLVIPYIAVDDKLVADALKLGFEAALSRAKQYWDARLAKGARVEVPDPVVVNQYKTLYPRTMITGDLDVEGDYALKTSPIHYDSVWLHIMAYGIESLSRRGHFEEARQYLDTGLRWQGSQASQGVSDVYTTWDGFFTTPKRYTAALWLNFHGWFQWAAARYYLFSDDKAWLEENLPALIESLQWTASQRKLTMRKNPDSSRPINYGWLPGGRVTDGSSGTSTFTDCINWMGFNEVVRVLERIDHPRAAEFRRVADDYRRCILRSLRLAARARESVRLNDGTFVPYVPGYLESEGHEENMWIAAVVDGALEGILDSGVVPPDDPLEDWVLGNLEDNLFVMAPNLADEGYLVGHGCGYIRRDQPRHANYTFYSLLATQMARQTMTTYEHRRGAPEGSTNWPPGRWATTRGCWPGCSRTTRATS